jgi:hypothetical protein
MQTTQTLKSSTDLENLKKYLKTIEDDKGKKCKKD